MPFNLHPQLDADAYFVCDLTLCRVLLMNDARFPWLILVPLREAMCELTDLSLDDQNLLLADINQAARTLQALYKPDKLNIAALGNVVPQLHIHIIARFTHDVAWPKPVWGMGIREVYGDRAVEVEKISAALTQ